MGPFICGTVSQTLTKRNEHEQMTIYRWNGHTCNKSSKTLEKTQRHQRFHSARRSSSSAAVSAWPPCRYCWRDRQHNGQLRWGWFFTVEQEALETNRQPLCLDMFGQFGLIICCFLIPWDIFVSRWTSNWLGSSCGINNANLEWSETETEALMCA